ncbi:MAG: family 16 glycoside hydrolase, partial [Planctomycetota bacterium]
EGQVMGTVDYMSPEQAMETRTVDIRTDIYSLGCTLYKLLVGRAPFARPEYETPIQKVMGHARDPVPPVREFRTEIPEAVAAAIERMMAKEPDGRFAVPAEVGSALAPFCEGSDLPALLTKAGPASQPVAEIAGPETSTEPQQASALTGTSSEPLREADLAAKPPIAPARRTPSASGVPVLSEEPQERFADLRSRLAAKRPSAKVWIANCFGAIRSRFAAGKPPARVWIAAGAAAAALFLLFGVVFYITTNNGTIKITLSDPNADVEVKLDRDVVEIGGLKDPLRLRVGEHGLVVTGKDYETVSKSFTIRRGENEVLEVVLVPKRPPVVDVIPEEPPLPPETIRPERTLANWGYVMSALFVPDDSSHAAFLKLGGEITRWDLGTEEDVFQFDGTGSWVAGMVVSADGRYLLCGADPDNTFRLMDMNTGKEIRRFQGHRAKVGRLAISSDGGRAVSADWDGNICLWNVETAERLSSFKGHAPLAFARDGRHVLFTCPNATSTFCLYDVVDGKEVRRFKGHEGNLRGLAVSQDGRLVLSASRDATARLWDVKTGREVIRFEGHTEGVGSPMFSPDGSRVLTASGDKTIRIWDVKTGREVCRLMGHREPIHSAVFSPGGCRVLSCGQDECRLWRLPESAGWQPLFDGKTLNGWKQIGGDAKFTVEDGVIVGTPASDGVMGYLRTEDSFDDFVLELEFKLDVGMNSGVQLGSHRGDGYANNRLRGHQVEIDDSLPRWRSGAVFFDEGDRIRWLDDLTDNQPAQEAFRSGEWNKLRVEVKGDSIKTCLNDVPAVDATDSTSFSGHIGLQAYRQKGKKPGQVRFRNIRLKEAEEGFVSLFDGKTLDGWQGDTDGYTVEDGKLVCLAKGFPTLFTNREYRDFVLRFDFRLEPGSNNGLLIRSPLGPDPMHNGMEIQILDDSATQFANAPPTN